MKQIIGDKIKYAITDLRALGIPVENNKKGVEDNYIIKRREFIINIKMIPSQWLGLSFYLLDTHGKKQITHDIDTDNYDISKQKYFSFAEQIENEIVEFLSSIRHRRILIGDKQGKLAMIIPKNKKYLLLTKRWLFVQGKSLNNLDVAKANGNFNPLNYE